MTEHTRGPWTYDANDKLNTDRAYGINRDLGPQAAEEAGVERATETIAEVCEGATALADARLIAAAPELLEAAKAAWIALPEARHNEGINAMLKAAIAKATGSEL